MHDYIVALILGVVEGLTEFLPVSSTGHMIIMGDILGFIGEKASVFEVFIQLGAILSVFILYREKFFRMFQRDNWFRQENGLSLTHIAAGILPVMSVGYLLYKPIKGYLFSTQTVIVGLIIGGLFMLTAEHYSRKGTIICDDVEKMTVKQAFFVGLFQILSLWPGFSRSGATISGGLLLGMSRKAAAEFSFIVAVPVMFVACIYDLLKIANLLSTSEIMMFTTGDRKSVV